MNPISNGRRLLCLVAAVGLLYGCDNDAEPPSQEDAGVDSTGSQTASESPSGAPDTGSSPDASSGESVRPTATADRSGTLEDQPPLEIEGLLKRDDVSSIADAESFEQADLPGRRPSPNYNARRFRPGSGDAYGAGLQVWSLDSNDEASERLSELRSQYLNVSDPPESAGSLAESGFVSTRSGIRNFVFTVASPPRVVAVSCSAPVCDSNEALAKLARRVAGRVRNGDGDGADDAPGSQKGGDDTAGDDQAGGTDDESGSGSESSD